jgi:hypothetical protein
MTKRVRGWILVALLVAAVLGAASVIVATNPGGGPEGDVPSGFVH